MLLEPTDKILQRIISNIIITDLGFVLNKVPSPCHIWAGSNSCQKRGNPYARMSILNVTTAVHLYLWKRFKGKITKNYQIDHMCNNTLCINLSHLQMVTNLKNQRLKYQRSREKNLESGNQLAICHGNQS